MATVFFRYVKDPQFVKINNIFFFQAEDKFHAH